MAEVEWRISDDLVAYEAAVQFMEARARDIRQSGAAEMVWLLEHPPLYTAGTSAKPEDLVDAGSFPVYKTGRGGQFTYHGPGQRVGYVMLDLTQRGNDIRRFVRELEEWLIRTLARFNLKGERRDGRIGIWIAENDGTERKIAALGVRVRHGVSFHGVALNVDPELAHFGGIVPCGIREHGVTSLAAQGILVSMSDVDLALKSSFAEVFGATESSAHAQRAVVSAAAQHD